MEVGFGYSFDEDGLMRLQKDLNHLLTNLNDQNVRSLKTEICTISARGRETVLDGSLIKMYDYIPATSLASTTLRLQMGYDKTSSNFSFKLFNAAGSETISIDSLGNAVFSGDISSSDDINVGDNIFLGISDAATIKGVYFNTTLATTEDPGISNWADKSGLLWNKSTDLLCINSTGNTLIGVKTKLKMGHVNGLGAFDNKIEITSSGIFLDGVVGGVRLGYATGNSYLGDAEVSTQLIATRGYTALKIARRITTTTIVSSTVMADDSVMNLTLDANARYQIEAHIAYWSTAASQKLLVSWSSDDLTTYASRECIGLSTDSTGVRGLSVFQRLNIGDIGRYGAPTAGGGTAALSEKMLVAVSSNGATLNIRFAQKVSSTTPMTISGNSYISARRVTT